MDEKCRLCLSHIENHSPMVTIGDVGFREKLETLFTFPIMPVELFPTSVCSECEAKVLQFHNYHEQVKHNQDHLCDEQQRQHFEEVKVEPPDLDFNAAEVSFEEAEPLEDAVKQSNILAICNDYAENNTDTKVGYVCSRDESENEYGANGRKRKIRKKKGTMRSKASQVKKGRKKFNPTDETNQQLQQFYDMKCEICAQKFDSFTTLKIHYHQQHKVQGYIKCCGRKFSSRYRLLEHLSFHVGASMVRCEICNKNFSSRSYLQVHNSRLHGSAEDRPFKCSQCHQSYAMECHLKAHMVSHVRVNCSICNKELSSSLSLRTHMINMHAKRENHICDSCGKEFRTRQAFDRHVNLHMGVDVTEQVQCSLCSKWLNSKRALKVHIKHVHTEAGQTFKCDLCTHECPNSRALANHKQRVHVEERFECEVCGKRFKRQLYLKEHIALHTGKPLYSCDICGATFNSNANKYSHRKNKHPVEWEARRNQQQLQAESG